jgi:hypothetical protein
MRNRLPAALLLLLSWFLPATAHAQAVQQVAAVSAGAAWRAEQQHSGVRHVPPPAPDVRAWSGPGGVTGAAAALASERPGVRHPWAVAARTPRTGAPESRRPLAAPARAPPSTTL